VAAVVAVGTDTYAGRYEFADTHESLVQAFAPSAMPEGLYERLVAAGHVRGRGWPQTAGLPVPDFSTPIRGDVERAKIPDGAAMKDVRGLVADFRWNE
jgi:hypothetical protein